MQIRLFSTPSKTCFQSTTPGGVHLGLRFGWESFPSDKPFFFSCLVISYIPFQNVLSGYEAEGTYEQSPRKKRVEIYTHIPELDENILWASVIPLSRPTTSHCNSWIFRYNVDYYFCIPINSIPPERNCKESQILGPNKKRGMKVFRRKMEFASLNRFVQINLQWIAARCGTRVMPT